MNSLRMKADGLLAGFPWLLLGGYALSLAMVTLFTQPFPQSLAYHLFADTRSLLGVPHFANTVSNLPMLLGGLAGLWVLRKQKEMTPWEQEGYVILFVGVALAGVGSTYYHLAPDNARMVWDRLLLVPALAAFVAVLYAERLPILRGHPKAFGIWVALGPLTVLYWWLGMGTPWEDLRPYGLFQGMTVLVPLLLLGLRSPYTLRGRYWLVWSCYLLAKGGEWLDAALFDWTGWLSGHTLKHLFVGLAVFLLVEMLWRRSRITPLPQIS